MVERLTTPRPAYPFLATKLAIISKGILAFVEAEPRAFLDVFKTVRGDELRCEIAPGYGFDLIVRESLRIPIPAVDLSSGRTLVDHLAATGSIYVFVGGREMLIALPAFELTLERADLLTAKGHYQMACLLRSQSSAASAAGPDDPTPIFREDGGL